MRRGLEALNEKQGGKGIAFKGDFMVKYHCAYAPAQSPTQPISSHLLLHRINTNKDLDAVMDSDEDVPDQEFYFKGMGKSSPWLPLYVSSRYLSSSCL